MAVGDPDYSAETKGTAGGLSGMNSQAINLNHFVSTAFGIPDIIGTGGASQYEPDMLRGIPFVNDPRTTIQRPGMSPTYRPPVNAGSVQGGVSGEYRIVKTPNEALAMLSELPPERMIEWKNAAYEAGLYDPGFYSSGRKPRDAGFLDEYDRNAMGRLMMNVMTAPEGTTAQWVLDQMKKDNPYSKENNFGRPKASATIQMEDPAAIRSYVRTTATELLGRDLPPEQMNSLVEKIMGQSRAAKMAGANAQIAAANSGEGGVTETQDVNIAARVEEGIMAADPGGVGANRFAEAYDVFFKMMMGGGGA